MKESLKHYRDLKGVIDTSFEEGEKLGIEKGRKEGEENKAKEMARKLKKKGIDIEIISETSGLSKEEIEKL